MYKACQLGLRALSHPVLGPILSFGILFRLVSSQYLKHYKRTERELKISKKDNDFLSIKNDTTDHSIKIKRQI